MFRSTFLSLLSLLTVVSGSPTPSLNQKNAISERAACSTLPASFVLAGDSTTAVNGGWGTGFISFLKSPAKGTNIAKSGATTVSFVNGGYWKKVIDQVKADAATHNVVVTIQVSSPAGFICSDVHLGFGKKKIGVADRYIFSLATMTKRRPQTSP